MVSVLNCFQNLFKWLQFKILKRLLKRLQFSTLIKFLELVLVFRILIKSVESILIQIVIKVLELVVELVLVFSSDQDLGLNSVLNSDQKSDPNCDQKFCSNDSNQFWSKGSLKSLIQSVVQSFWKRLQFSVLIKILNRFLFKLWSKSWIGSCSDCGSKFWKGSLKRLLFSILIEIVVPNIWEDWLESNLFKDPCSDCGSKFCSNDSNQFWSRSWIDSYSKPFQNFSIFSTRPKMKNSIWTFSETHLNS